MHIYFIDSSSQVYHLALVSARNMQVTKGLNLSSISCLNREKFAPLLLACLTRYPPDTWGGPGLE